MPMQFHLDRRRHVLEVLDRGTLAASFPVAVGRDRSPTPEGRWRIQPATRPADHEALFELNTPSLVCIRETADLASLGQDASGG